MKNFDFIVVGAGASGSALVSTLASKGPTLLIERGANHTAYPQSSVREGWPQITTLAMNFIRNEGSGHWTGAPSILGGGTAIGAGGCFRPADKELIFGSLGMDIKDVDAAFNFLEDHLCRPGMVENEYSKAFIDAWSSTLGLEHRENNNSTSTYGFSTPGTIQRGGTIFPINSYNNFQYEDDEFWMKRRPSSHLFERKSFNKETKSEEESILNKGNLTVYLMTSAKRIIFDESKTAKGVEIVSPAGNATIYVRNGGKIFLNTGVYETPKLLMLSGIGPEEVLQKHDIPIVHRNKAVGQNLIDRKYAPIQVPMFNNLSGDDAVVFDAAGFTDDGWVSASHKYSHTWGNALMGCGLCLPADRTKECKEKIQASLIMYGFNRNEIHLPSMIIYQRRPTVRGNVTLFSNDYLDDPVVNDGWNTDFYKLSDDARTDLKIISQEVQKFALDVLLESDLLENLGHQPKSSSSKKFSDELLSFYSQYGTQVEEASTKDFKECSFNPVAIDFCDNWDDCYPTMPQVRNVSKSDDGGESLLREIFTLIGSSLHMMGTCSVGQVVNKGSLEVKGVKSLYIADLSIVNEPVDVYPMLTAMTIGLLTGTSTEAVPTGQYEVSPVALSLIIMTLIISLLSLWVLILMHSCFCSRTTAARSLNSGEALPTKQQRKMLKNHVSTIPEEDKWEDNVDAGSGQLNLRHPASTAANVLMSWRDISCSYPIKKKMTSSFSRCWSSPDDQEHTRSITTLFKAFGIMKEGEVTAIMGPSGASKSTLVDILAGRKSIGNITGKCSMLGHNFDLSTNGLKGLSKVIMNVSAYIPQQEFFYPTQTLEEAIHFVINMKFGKGDPNIRRSLTYDYLDMVGLPSDIFASRRIGGDLGGGFSIRGLSGGERKRLALACMLALEPKIMFIDELTSGLDSENALMIIKLLKDLSIKKNVASMVIIHQPDPDVFALFDRLILLSKGHTMFSGLCSDLPTFYRTNFNESMPAQEHLAKDLIAKASNIDPRLITYQGVGQHQQSEVDEDTSFKLSQRKSTITLEKDLEEAHDESLILSSDVIDLNYLYEEEGPSQLWKLLIVFNRNLTNQYIRNVGNVGARLLSYTMISVIVGMIFWNVGETESNMGLDFEEAALLIRSSIFLMNVSYLLPFTTIPVFIVDKKFFAAESALGLYSSWMYGVSQLFLEFVFVTIASIIEASIVINMCAMWNPVIPAWASFLSVLAVLIFSGLVGSTIILCCSMWLPTQDLAFVLASTISTISLALCGGFRPASDMPDIPYALQWISPVKYSYQALLISLLTGSSSERILDIQEYDAPSTVTSNLLVLTSFFLVLCIVTAVGMARVKEAR